MARAASKKSPDLRQDELPGLRAAAPASRSRHRDVRLTHWATEAGNAAKWGRTGLLELLGGVASEPTGVLAGLDPYDDAGVVRLTDELALVSTATLLPPLVDDPAAFGAVAAAHACSNVFAMGGRVVSALHLAAFPDDLPAPSIRAMFKAAAAVVAEAGGAVVGGQTIRADEPVFGLAVQGLVHPDHVLVRAGARPGDVVVLSKPIGTGIVLAGGSDDEKARVVDGMRMLNRGAAARLAEAGAACHAVTDVSGFGLLGTVFELAERSGVCVLIDAEMVPCYRGAKQLAASGARASGAVDNRSSFGPLVSIGTDVAGAMEALAFDPQTSGGLLAAVEPDDVATLVGAGFRPIGTVREAEVDEEGYATESLVHVT
ncbi:MAG: selenide, water dikinase SelD [Actinobacteria bacterium]|nr:selenide, water dikinase SelD [Actinomycetota bacterium]